MVTITGQCTGTEQRTAQHIAEPASLTTGTLYVVATPIGNLADMVPRAVETLQTVAVIAAEDTRHSARLLDHFAIKTPAIAYHDHSDEQRTDNLIKRLLAGEHVALISDAGTPLVSDPGYRLVRRAREQGIRVVPIPGACAVVAALSAAGLPSNRFAFEGVANDPRTLVFYEAPHRILETLQDMARVFGPEREVVMARELTKTFETIKGDKVAALADWVAADSNQQRGEIVLLVQGLSKVESAEMTPEQQRIMKVLLAELPVKQAAAMGAKITGLKKNFLYQWGLAEIKADESV
jgi:16S rRNA (cytidine1402-2'-O)-methyltransferase